MLQPGPARFLPVYIGRCVTVNGAVTTLRNTCSGCNLRGYNNNASDRPAADLEKIPSRKGEQEKTLRISSDTYERDEQHNEADYRGR